MTWHLGCLALLLAASVCTAERRVALIVDTSGSMLSSDPPRYTVQLGQIISDLLAPGDHLTVVRLPLAEASCAAGPNPSLAVQLDASNRAGFKRALDGLISYGGGNNFAATIRTALQALGEDPSVSRLLLMIADSGGLDACDAELTRDLVRLHQSGTLVAAINIGSTTGAFETNPAFDLRTPATDSERLVRAVAEVYQRFLGAKNVQTGRVQGGEVHVRVDSFVRDAFLVVAADGPVGPFREGGSNPKSDSLDLNYLGGGQTVGLDRVTRGYRIAKMQRPGAGAWTFTATGLNATAGWMLVQDYAVGLRLVSSSKIPDGTAAVIEAELVDERNGQRISDTSQLAGLDLAVAVDGQEIHLHDDGTNGDRTQKDGVFSGTATLRGTGKKQMLATIHSDLLARSVTIDAEVIEAGWRLEPLTARRVPMGTSTVVRAKIESLGAGVVKPPDRVQMETDGGVVELNDMGHNGDDRVGDGIYSGPWIPAIVGSQTLHYTGVGGGSVLPASQSVEVIGHIEFGTAIPCVLGTLRSKSDGHGALDLSTAKVSGWVDVQMRSSFEVPGTRLEIDTGSGWKKLGGTPLSLRVDEGSSRAFPVRLRVADCPGSSKYTDPRQIELSATAIDGKVRQFSVPLQVEVIPDSWWHCWWPVVVAAAAVVVAFLISYGFWSPSRFAPRVGIMLAPEEDVDNEGFFYPIRGQPGSRSGFYRDAAVYICQDFRIAAKSPNALAKLRADRSQIRMLPTASIWRRTADGEWEELPHEEVPVRPGVLYRNDARSLFFEVRTR